MRFIYTAFILFLALMTSAQCQKTAEDFFYEGNALCMQDKYDEAIKYYDEVIRLDPRNTAALNNKANALNALNALRRTDEEDAAIAKSCQRLLKIGLIKALIFMPKTSTMMPSRLAMRPFG
jgi:tetratricopeptide (TPR) repeat protein